MFLYTKNTCNIILATLLVGVSGFLDGMRGSSCVPSLHMLALKSYVRSVGVSVGNIGSVWEILDTFGQGNIGGLFTNSITCRGTIPHIDSLAAVRFDGNQQQIIASDDQGQIIITPLKKDSQIHMMKIPSSNSTEKMSARALQLSNNGTLLVSAGLDGKIHIWDMIIKQHIGAFTHPSTGRPQNYSIEVLNFMRNGTVLVSAGIDGKICFWDFSEPQNIKEPCLIGLLQPSIKQDQLSDSSIRSVVISDDQKKIFAAVGNALIISDVTNLSDIKISGKVLDAHIAPIQALVLMRNEKILISAAADGAITLWDISEPSRVAKRSCINTHVGSCVNALALMADDTMLIAMTSPGNWITLWNITQLDHPICVVTQYGHTSWARGLWVDTDSNFFISASSDKTVKIWTYHTLAYMLLSRLSVTMTENMRSKIAEKLANPLFTCIKELCNVQDSAVKDEVAQMGILLAVSGKRTNQEIAMIQQLLPDEKNLLSQSYTTLLSLLEQYIKH